MSIHSSLVAGILFPVHEKLKGHSTTRVHRDMEASQWKSGEQMAQLQLRRLRGFFTDISSRVPYFRDLFAELGLDPAAISSILDLQKLPLMDKAIIRANTNRLKSEGAEDLQLFNTGGSSGEPLIFYLGKERVSHDVAAKRRATRWWGVDIGDPEIVLWGSPIELNSQDRLRSIRDRLFRTELLSAFDMSEKNLALFIKKIRSKRPRMLFGYPSSLAYVAQYAQARGIAMNDLGIRVAFVTSERLYSHQREQIESVFGCPVANGYGGRDAGFIAHECPEGALHITAEDIIVEIVRMDGSPASPGEAGEIVVTHMATADFPFVRYRTGDVGKLDNSPCKCGRGLPVLAEVQGRTTDFIVAANGTVMHGLALIYVLRKLDGIKEFKIVQESLDLVRVIVIPDSNWVEEIRVQIETEFRSRLGNQVCVEVELGLAIESEASGKTRYVVSHVVPDFSAATPGV